MALIKSSPTAKSSLTDLLLGRLRDETWKHMMQREWNAVSIKYAQGSSPLQDPELPAPQQLKR